jgi:hypothetical protein
MTPVEFFKSVYLGDRWCKRLELDGEREELRIAVDLISRVRGENWDFYSAEDIEDGFLVFEGVRRATLEPSGLLPNAWIEPLEVTDCGNGEHKFCFSLGSVDHSAKSTEIVLTIVATSMAVQDKAGSRIRR